MPRPFFLQTKRGPCDDHCRAWSHLAPPLDASAKARLWNRMDQLADDGPVTRVSTKPRKNRKDQRKVRHHNMAGQKTKPTHYHPAGDAPLRQRVGLGL